MAVRPDALLRRARPSRRLAAGLLAALAAGITVDALAVGPPAGVPVVVAASDLAAGQRLDAADVTAVTAPRALVPDGAADPGDLAGTTLAAPLRRGEILTDARLVGPGLLAGQPAGMVAVPVRPSDEAGLALLRPGHRVRVIAGPAPYPPDQVQGASGAVALVDEATVLALPPAPSAELLGDGPGPSVVVLAVTGPQALRLVSASDGRWLALALLP